MNTKLCSIAVGCGSLAAGYHWPITLILYYHATFTSNSHIPFYAWFGTLLFHQNLFSILLWMACYLALFYEQWFRNLRFFLKAEDFVRDLPPQWKMPFLRRATILDGNVNVGRQPRLVELYVSRSTVYNLAKLQQLQTLRLVSSELPSGLDQLKSLECFALNMCPARQVRLPTKVRKVSIQHCRLETINLGDLKNLVSLNLVHNALSQVDALALLPNLRKVYLSRNSITRLPQLTTQLETLWVNENKLTELDCMRLVNLVYLNAMGNQLKRQPRFAANSNLEELSISGNPISELDLGHLQNLGLLTFENARQKGRFARFKFGRVEETLVKSIPKLSGLCTTRIRFTAKASSLFQGHPQYDKVYFEQSVAYSSAWFFQLATLY